MKLRAWVGQPPIEPRLLCLIAITVSFLLFLWWASSKPKSSEPTADKTDTAFLQLRFEHSGDLVDELDGIRIYQTYSIRCNDGKDRPVKVALLDRGLQRVGLVYNPQSTTIETSSENGTGSLGARAYTKNSTAFVSLDWFQTARKEAAAYAQ